MKASRLKVFLWNLYPPFVGAGIKITDVDPDWRWLEARLKFRWWNRNYVGTVFGGSMFSLCDPFHMVLVINRLGANYVVRDKGGAIQYVKKGNGDLFVRFELTDAELEDIKANPAEVQERKFSCRVRNAAGEVVAEVQKTLHVRRLNKD